MISLLNLTIKYNGFNEPNLRKCLTDLRNITLSDKDYFKIENYKGKALGAGAPASVAVALWAKEIKKSIPDFPCEDELNPDGYALLKKLENEIRTCIQIELGKVARNWWKEKRALFHPKQSPFYEKSLFLEYFYLFFNSFFKKVIARAHPTKKHTL